MDQNNPARFLDTAYNALKANPGATNQILQAAAQGQPVGLKGLAAAAAQQSQQEAQKTMAALQQQGPQPNIVQKLATQGIMSQMDTGLPIAPQMGAPEEMPQQMMAGGGLVAFAGGGNVLPPDVIDAIQSHFAEGGDVRGFAEGDEVLDAIRNYFAGGRKPRYTVQSDVMKEAYANSPYVQAERAAKEAALKGIEFPYDEYALPESSTPKAPKGTPSSLQLRGQGFAPPELSPWTGEAEGGFGKLTQLLGKAKAATGPYMQALRDVSPYAMLLDPRVISAVGMNVEAAKKIAGMDSNLPQAVIEAAESHRQKSPSEIAGDLGLGFLSGQHGTTPKLAEVTPDDLIDVADMDGRSARAETLKDDRGNKIPAPSVRKPDATLVSHESTVKPDIIEEGKKVDKAFDKAATTPETGLGGLDQGKETVDYLKGLLGEKKMDPEIAKKLEDLESGARTSTILQSVLGGLAGGLSNPYGGRFALGSAALNALGGYQKGIASEEDIQRKALDIERAYADQPAETQQAAAKMYIDLLGDKAKLQSAERVAEGKAESAWDRLMQSEEGKLLRAQIMAGQKGDVTEGQKLTAWNQAREQAAKEVKDEYVGTTPPEGELERRTQKHYMAALNSILAATGGLGAGQAQQQQYGLGAAPTGRSIIGGKLTGSSPQQ